MHIHNITCTTCIAIIIINELECFNLTVRFQPWMAPRFCQDLVLICHFVFFGIVESFAISLSFTELNWKTHRGSSKQGLIYPIKVRPFLSGITPSHTCDSMVDSFAKTVFDADWVKEAAVFNKDDRFYCSFTDKAKYRFASASTIRQRLNDDPNLTTLSYSNSAITHAIHHAYVLE